MEDKRVRVWFENNYIDLFIPNHYFNDEEDKDEVFDFVYEYVCSMMSIEIKE